MPHRATTRAGRWGAVVLVLALLAGYWLLPISGQVVIVTGDRAAAVAWPRIQVSAPLELGRAATVEVTDVVPWAYTRLTINGLAAGRDTWWAGPGGVWTWQWTVTPTEAMLGTPGGGATIAFYRDCDTGCIRRGQVAIGGQPSTAATPAPARLPTKLGLVFADPARDWRGRQGWTVELTYARLADSPAPADERWGIDGLATRVALATRQGVRVLVRVDLARDQSLPPAGDQLALDEYLRYARRLGRDERLRDVYGYIVGAGFNALDSNQQAPQRPVTPAWYARLFNGAGEPSQRADNVVQVIKGENPRARVLVGSVRSWSRDQGGDPPSRGDAPWLGYMDRLVAALDEGAMAKAAAAISLAGPDGFALHAAGRPELAARLTGRNGADEPLLSLTGAGAEGPQLGFRVFQEYLAIINAYPATRGLPAYITSANTFTPDDGTPPAQNYPRGWLTAALRAVNDEPQIAALCWFVDGPLGDSQWDWFSLSPPAGRLIDAAEEFDRLLQLPTPAACPEDGRGTAARPTTSAPWVGRS